ncbi:phage tail sheath family protein [Brachybacterium vulturis]|uniref:phage tail sheath family protein n=1 Tax=Brachybacterium vulturis TaxID=2017484 RepID=UPI0037356B70
MPTYTTPGVYIEEIPSFPPSVAPVATAIPAFIGCTEKARRDEPGDLHQVPTRIESLVEFQELFGGPPRETAVTVTIAETTDSSPEGAGFAATATLPDADRSPHLLFPSLRLFFANGGGSCYIVSSGRFAEDGDATGDAPGDGDDGTPDDGTTDDDPGAGGGGTGGGGSGSAAVGPGLTVAAFATAITALEAVDEPTLLVIPEAQQLEDIAAFAGVWNSALTQCLELGDRFALLDLFGADDAVDRTALNSAVTAFRNEGPIIALDRGAAYAPNLVTQYDVVVDTSVTNVAHTIDDGAPTTKTLDEWTAANTQVHERAVAAIRDLPVVLPPSAALAGICARIDGERGVWKAPANVALVDVLRPTVEVTDAQQGEFNIDSSGKSINAIRTRTGRGTVVWGARTLAGNSNEWRYVSVRRFFLFAGESIRKATEQFVFEPNDANTWVKVQSMIENFLTLQWRAGALQGVKPEHAFYVAVGLGRTMTAMDILEGRMIVEIGMAAVRPAEFIVLRFSHTMAQS